MSRFQAQVIINNNYGNPISTMESAVDENEARQKIMERYERLHRGKSVKIIQIRQIQGKNKMKHIKVIGKNHVFFSKYEPRCPYCGSTDVEVNGDWKYICYACNREFDEDDA